MADRPNAVGGFGLQSLLNQAAGVNAAEVPQGAVPFNGDAGSQWHPAMGRANEYAKSLGYDYLRFEGTGMRAKGIPPQGQLPPVNSIEVQRLLIGDKAGQEHELGTILPEAAHLSSLKSTDQLFSEMKKMIDDYHSTDQVGTKNAPAAKEKPQKFSPRPPEPKR